MLRAVLCTNPGVSSEQLKALFAVVWPEHLARDLAPGLRRSLVYVRAYQRGRLVGFVNVAWEGGVHALLLDTTVHPDV